MVASAFIHLRVTQETKLRLRALAQRECRTESALLKELLAVMLRSVGNEVLSEPRQDQGGLCQARLTVRLQPSDQMGEVGRGRISAWARHAARFLGFGVMRFLGFRVVPFLSYCITSLFRSLR
jgi:hypothetical protein